MTLAYIEARQWERVPVEIRVTVVLNSDPCKLPHDALTLDLSWSGARLRSTGVALMPGQVLDLLMARSGAMLRKLARVVWVGEAECGQAGEAGVRFMHPIAVP